MSWCSDRIDISGREEISGGGDDDGDGDNEHLFIIDIIPQSPSISSQSAGITSRSTGLRPGGQVVCRGSRLDCLSVRLYLCICLFKNVFPTTTYVYIGLRCQSGPSFDSLSLTGRGVELCSRIVERSFEDNPSLLFLHPRAKTSLETCSSCQARVESAQRCVTEYRADSIAGCAVAPRSGFLLRLHVSRFSCLDLVVGPATDAATMSNPRFLVALPSLVYCLVTPVRRSRSCAGSVRQCTHTHTHTHARAGLTNRRVVCALPARSGPLSFRVRG